MIQGSFLKFFLIALSGSLLFEPLKQAAPSSVSPVTKNNESYTYVEDIVGFAPYFGGFEWSQVEHYKSLGYKHVDGDFNKNAGYDRAEVYLMYKTTDDEKKAIRKVSTMEMDGGYSSWDYSSIVEGYDPNIRHSVSEFREAANYYASKYRANNEAAVEAKKLLDFYMYPKTTTETTGEKLGSFLLNNRSDDEYKRILLYSNSAIFGNIVNAILLSSVESGPKLWMNRFVEELKNPICNNSDPENETEYSSLQNKYGSSLEVISSNIQEYVKNLQAAKARYANGNFDDGETFISVEDTIQKMISKCCEQPPEGSEDALLLQYDAFLSSYGVFNVGGQVVNKTLADIINEMGQGDLSATYGYMYALVNSLNPAQFFGLKNGGLEGLMLYTSFSLNVNEANLSAEQKPIYDQYGKLSCIDKMIEKSRKDFVTYLGTDCISIYRGTNSDLLDRNCAMTSEAMRSNAALNELDKLMAEDELQENLIKALTIVGYAAGICGCIAMASFSIGSFLFSGAGFVSLIKMGVKAIRGIVVRTVKTIIGSVVGVGGVAGIVVCVCIAIIIGIIILVKKIKEHIEDLHERYSAIPEVLIDRTLVNGESLYSRYDVVRNITNNQPFDMNFQRTYINTLGEHKYATKFNAMYFTKDKRIGAPLIEKDGVFMVHTNSAQKATNDMYPVCKFGNYSQVNFNAHKTNTSAPACYAYYNVKGTVVDPIFKNGKYIESVILKCDKNNEIARNSIINEGFNLFDRNLSPNNSYATYIGYRTTDNRDQALTDIRVAWNDTSDVLYWGDMDNTYAFAGSATQDVSNNGDNSNHVSLYYTKKRSLGTPILSHVNVDESVNPDGFGFSLTADSIPEGFEGINFFTGGRAFDFNFYNKMKEDNWNNQKSFLYFKPEVQYTHENSYIYFSGLGFFAGQSFDTHPLDQLYFDSGFLPDEISGMSRKFEPIAKGINVANVEGEMNLQASYTYNPYRAIYDIGVQTGQENNPYLPNNIVAQNQGYISVNTYCQGDRKFYGQKNAKKWRVIRDSHTYINNGNKDIDEGMTGDSHYRVQCPRALYCSGPTAGRTAIEANGIRCYKEQEKVPLIRNGWCSAHELKNHYYTETVYFTVQEKAFNLAQHRYERYYDDDFLFLFYKSTLRERPKYVEAVYTYESTAEKSSYNETMLNLLYMGCDEIFEDFTISKLNKKGKDFNEQIFFHITDDKNNWSYVVDGDDWTRSGLYHHQDGVGFLGVKYTNKKAAAISDIKTYCLTKDEFAQGGSKNPSDLLNLYNDISGTLTSFTRATDKITCSDDAYMWLYTSKTGNKITDLKLVSGFAANITDEQINSHQFTISSHMVTDQTLSNTRCPNFRLLYEKEEGTYIKDLVYFYTRKEMIELTVMSARQYGCTDFKIYKLDDYAYFVIGLVRTTSRLEAIKDIRLTFDANYNTNIGGSDYILAKQIQTPFTYQNGPKMYISYTRGTNSDNNYALTDITFISSNGQSSAGTNVGTYEDVIPETCFDFGSSANGGNFEITFADGKFTIGMVRKSSKYNWGYQGPKGATASIFADNPSLATLLILLGVVALASGIGISLYYYEKKRAHASR